MTCILKARRIAVCSNCFDEEIEDDDDRSSKGSCFDEDADEEGEEDDASVSQTDADREEEE